MSSVFQSGTFDDLKRERSSLLGVFHRIGMTVRTQEYSYSEMEFDLATIQGMDRLVYIKAAGGRPKHDVDGRKASARNESAKKIEESGCTYGRFKTAQELAVQVAIDTMRYLHDQDWIRKFRAALDMDSIEEFADNLGTLGGHRAVDALLYRLGDDPVQQDDDLHEAVCGALAKLKVMRRRGPNHYVFRRLKSLPSNVRQRIDRYRQLIPDKYFPKT